MLRLGIVVVGMVFLFGCTTQKEKALMDSYKEKIEYHKQLQKTEKVQLFDQNNATQIVLTATYLYTPNFKKYDIRDEEFIVGVHFEDGTEADTQDIIEIFGIRTLEDVKRMRDQQKKKGKVVRNSLYDDMIRFLNADNNDTLKSMNDENGNKANSKPEDEKIKYGLTIEGKYAIEIETLDRDDERLANIAYVTDWGSYYLVKFEHVKSKRFSLVFNSEKYGNGTFPFAKVAKYIYTKKGF